MSCVIKVKSSAAGSGIDPGADLWLEATEYAGDNLAAMRLSRALNPAGNGFPGREPLPVPQHGSADAAAVLALLGIGCVPTPAAVRAYVPPEQSATAARRKWWADQASQVKQVLADTETVDTAGGMVSEIVAKHWIDHGVGPVWREVTQDPDFTHWWIGASRLDDVELVLRNYLMPILGRRGWVAYSSGQRSLCTGRAFHSRSFGTKVSPVGPDTAGFLTSQAIHEFRVANGRSPDWAELADTATDHGGIPLFFDARHAHAESHWLITRGWVVIKDGQLRRTDKARREARRRASTARVGEPNPA